MKSNHISRKIQITTGVAVFVIIASALFWTLRPTSARAPEQLEYLPASTSALAEGTPPPAHAIPAEEGKKEVGLFDFDTETVGMPPKTFVPVVGNWLIGQDGDKRVLVVDGRKWSQGQTASGIAEHARSLYGERYAEFLDNVQSFAYFPYAVASGIEDFREGEIVLHFKSVDGRIDQSAGILFDLKPNGDYLALRANPLEQNLVLWQFQRGHRSSLEWIRNTPTPSRQWHELKIRVTQTTLEGYINGKRYLTYSLPHPVSGRVGIWSKADSVVYFDDYRVTPARLISASN